MNVIKKLIIESIQTKLAIAHDNAILKDIERVANIIIARLIRSGKILIAGNGGSAADAQHFAAELAGKFLSPDRAPLPAIALTTNSSNITAIGNDFSYDEIFSRQLAGLGMSGDIFFAISTSGNSPNILKALETAKSKNMITLSLLGNGGGRASYASEFSIIIPSSNTQNIQEAHIMVIHILCQIIDEVFARRKIEN